MGCIGMSYDDFCRCTFGEFESICRAWREMTELREREAWERMRTLGAVSIQPHVRKRLTPRQLLPMPWDKKTTPRPEGEAVMPTPEERLRRFRVLADV